MKLLVSSTHPADAGSTAGQTGQSGVTRSLSCRPSTGQRPAPGWGPMKGGLQDRPPARPANQGSRVRAKSVMPPEHTDRARPADIRTSRARDACHERRPGRWRVVFSPRDRTLNGAHQGEQLTGAATRTKIRCPARSDRHG
jgi:hypothetical protein